MTKRWSVLTALLCVTLVTSACGPKESVSKEMAKQVTSVEVQKAQVESLDAISSLTATLLPYEETLVSFELGGTIQTMAVEVGDKIQSGSVLASLKSTDYELQVKQADGTINQALAGINASEASMTSAQSNITSALARINSAQASLDALLKGARDQERVQAKNTVQRATDVYDKIKVDAERIAGLYEEGLVSQKEYDDIQLQLTNAQKDVVNAQQTFSMIEEGPTVEQRKQGALGVEEARAGKTQANAGVTQAQAAKQQAQAVYEQALVAKEQAQLTLSKTQLKSPLAGVVMDKIVSVGQRVGPGETVYKLGQINQLKVLLPVPDRDIKNWKIGDEVTVYLYEKEKTAKVTMIYPQTNTSTGTISVEVVIPNSKLDWVPGQIIKASRVTTDNEGILVPIEAVISNGSDPYVFKVIKGKAVKTSVEIGDLVDNKIHIISGLKEDEPIVVRGAELLLDGDPVDANGGNKK